MSNLQVRRGTVVEGDMTKRDVLGIAIRILGIWMLATLISTLPSLAYPFTTMRGASVDAKSIFFMELTSCCLTLIVGFYLLAFARRIAAALMPEDTKLAWPEWIEGPGALFGFGAGIFGLVLVARTLPPFLAHIWQYVWVWWRGLSFYGKATDWLAFASEVILLAAGLGLLFGSRKLGAWIEQIGEPETEPKNE